MGMFVYLSIIRAVLCQCRHLAAVVSARAHRSCWPRRSYLAHVKASYLLRVRNIELRVLKIAISSLSICRGRRVDGTLKLRSGTRRHILNTIPSICRVQHENCRFRFSSGSPAPTLSKPSRARVLTSA